MEAVIIIKIEPEEDGTYYYDDSFHDDEYIARKLGVLLTENFNVGRIKVILLDSESKDE